MDYAKMMHTAQHQHQQNGDPSQFKRDSRKLYREFDPKKFRKEVLVPKEKMKKMAKSNTDNAPSDAPKQNSENKQINRDALFKYNCVVQMLLNSI